MRRRPGHDPLAVLARLREVEVTRARRGLMEATAARAEADLRQRDAAAALVTERSHGGAPYAAWLPRGLMAEDAAASAARAADARVAEAGAALGAARAAERAVEKLAEFRAEEERRLAGRAEQRLLDEAGARRR